MTYAAILFILANLTITSGYLYVAVKIVPNFKVTKWYTKVGGVFFFLLCGMTHLEMAYHAWSDTHFSLVSPISLLIHVPQAIAVWMFVYGIYVELIRGSLTNNKED